MSTMKPAVVILFCAASAASAAFVDLDNWWDPKPDPPVVKNGKTQQALLLINILSLLSSA